MIDGRVLILSSSPETLDSVQAYLVRAGVTALGVAGLEQAERVALESDALLLFADDYGRDDVLCALASLPASRRVIVTSDVETYESLARTRDRHDRLIVLRRPAWGWVLLDALRADRTEGSELVQT